MSFITRRRTLVTLGAVGALAVAGIAYAYFTGSGSGTGTATVGTSAGLTLHGTTSSSLYPGSSTAVSFTVDNPNSGKAEVGTIHLQSIVACNTAFSGGACPSGHEVSTCESVETGATDGNTANFWMPDVAVNTEVSSGNGQTITPQGTLTMNDLASSQDSCKGVNLLLNLSS
jgi:hypothetical protein